MLKEQDVIEDYFLFSIITEIFFNIDSFIYYYYRKVLMLKVLFTIITEKF